MFVLSIWFVGVSTVVAHVEIVSIDGEYDDDDDDVNDTDV